MSAMPHPVNGELLLIWAPNTSPTSAIATVTLAGQGLMVMARAGVHPAELRAQARATGAGIAANDA